MDQLWKAVLAEIEVEVSKPTFLTFFKDTHITSHDGNVVTISAPTFIHAEYIEKRYYSLIKKIIDKKTSSDTSLIFVSGVRTEGLKDNGPLFTSQVKKVVARPKRVRVDFNFDTFAVSDSNQLAYTAALTVASSPGQKYNPVFFYGTVGVGKTHLMNAMANKILDDNPSSQIVYLTSEEFTNEVVESIRDKTTAHMRKKFRTADLLLLDDIQFLSGKEKVQEELFHTFNTLIDRGSQIVFSSDKPPSEIKKLEARLASRFEAGLTVDIEPPDVELRRAILEIKANKYNLEITSTMADSIAEKITDARKLEGFLLRLSSEMMSTSQSISEIMIQKLLGGVVREEKKRIRADDVVEAICDHFSIKTTQLKGSKRDASLVMARQICMYLLKEEFGLTFVEVGNILGGRDHTTIMHGVEKIRLLVEKEQDIVKDEIVSVRKRIESEFA